MGFQQKPIRYDPSGAPIPAGKPSFDSLKTLKKRMAKKQRHVLGDLDDAESSVTGTAYSEAPFGVESVASWQLDAGKDEIEGSKPRKWKPALAPQAPPGGPATFHPARDGKGDSRFGGKKLFPQAGGAGTNRDAHAIEALRFYQDEERLGKHAPERLPIETEKNVRDTHRYYLAAEGKSGIVPGKASVSERRRSDVSGSIIQHEVVPAGKLHSRSRPLASQQSTSASGAEEAQSECDSLPLGAEWSTWGTPREAAIAAGRSHQQRAGRA
jgi:hypothetical protein